MQIELTTQESQVLVNLLDIACKAGGLQVAEACVVLTRKIGAAQENESKPEVPPAA